MGCLQVNVTLEPIIKALVSIKNTGLKVFASNKRGIYPIISRIGHSPIVGVSNMGGLKVRCGVVCSLAEVLPYIEVEPDVIWLTPSNNFSEEVVVYSNVTWVIE
jgi:hypothetical protein